MPRMPLDEPGGDASDGPSGAWRHRSDPVAVVVVVSGPMRPDFLDTLSAATSRNVDLVQVSTVPVEPVALGGRMVAVAERTTYAAAVNAGVRGTTAEYVVVANPAIRWEPGSLDRLLAAARRWPTAAAFGPLICLPDGSPYPSARAVPTLGRGIGHAVLGRWWPGNPWTAAYRGAVLTPVERTTGWLSGSCLLLRRDAFDAIGGFDTEFVAYFEDLDLGERLGRAGWHNVYVPSAVVHHSGTAVTGAESASMSAEHHRSALRYLSRRYHGLRWLPLRLVLRAGLALRSRLTRRDPDAQPDDVDTADTAA